LNGPGGNHDRNINWNQHAYQRDFSADAVIGYEACDCQHAVIQPTSLAGAIKQEKP